MAHLIEELGDLYSQVGELHVEDTKRSITEVISVLIDEGYSDSAITCYFETQESINIVEKFVNISEDYTIPDTNTERISSIYQEGWAGRLGKALIKSGKPILRKAKNFVTGGAKAASKSGAADDVVKSTSRTAGGNTVTGSNWKSGANPKGKPGGDVPVKGIKDTVKDGINSAKKGIKDNPVGTAAAGLVGGGILATSIATGDAANKKAKKELENQKKANNMGVLTPGGITKKPEVKKTPEVKPEVKPELKKNTGLSFGDAIKAANTDAGKALIKSVTSSDPKKPSTASGKELPKAKEVKKGSAKANMIARNKERFGKDSAGNDRVDKLRSKNAAFQAAKKAGSNYSMDDFVKDFPNSNAAKDRKKSKRVTSVMDMESVQHSGETVDEAMGLNLIRGGIKKTVSVIKDKVAQSKGQPTSKQKAAAKADTTSPAAKAGMSSDLRARAAAKHAKFKRDRAAGKLKSKTTTVQKVDPNMESYDAYDIVLDYLLETNQVATVEEANYVMLEMDSKTIQDIVNNK